MTTYDADGDETGTEQLLECDEVVVPTADEAALGTMAVVGFDADDPTEADVMGVATDTTARLRLAHPDVPREQRLVRVGLLLDPGAARPDRPGGDGRSRIYAFELDGTDATYTASGVVDGVIADRWAMDEYDDVLRVAVGPSQETGNFNSVVTLREDGDELEEIGRVDKLGVNEDIKSVRWFDGLAIVVTFRQVDPLYAIDLTDPDAPTLLGELKIPGFSEYLHPISGQRLIGMGQDASLERHAPRRAGRPVRRLRPDRPAAYGPGALRQGLRRRRGRRPAPVHLAARPGHRAGRGLRGLAGADRLGVGAVGRG